MVGQMSGVSSAQNRRDNCSSQCGFANN